MDVAQLGISVDTTQVTKATTALAGLSGAAKTASPAVAALEKAAAPANAALASMAKATAGASTAHAGLSTQAMAAGHAVRSMAEGLALGLPPTQILSQQLSHLSYAASGPGGISGAFTEVGAAMLRFISPAGAVAVALAAIAAATVYAVARIAQTEKAFGELSERTGQTVQSLHALESAAATEGIGSPEFLKGVTQFNELTVEAQHNTGALAELFRANGVAVGNVRDNLSKVADLIHNSATEQDKYRLLQELGLPTTRQWVQLLGQGSDKLKEATNNATAFGDAADVRLIQAARQFEKSWDTVLDSWSKTGKAAIVDLFDLIQSGSERTNAAMMKLGMSPNIIASQRMNIGLSSTLSQSQADDFYRATHAPGGPPSTSGPLKVTVNPQDLQKTIALEMPRLGLLGETPTIHELEPEREEKDEDENDRDNRRHAA